MIQYLIYMELSAQYMAYYISSDTPIPIIPTHAPNTIRTHHQYDPTPPMRSYNTFTKNTRTRPSYADVHCKYHTTVHGSAESVCSHPENPRSIHGQQSRTPYQNHTTEPANRHDQNRRREKHNKARDTTHTRDKDAPEYEQAPPPDFDHGKSNIIVDSAATATHITPHVYNMSPVNRPTFTSKATAERSSVTHTGLAALNTPHHQILINAGATPSIPDILLSLSFRPSTRGVRCVVFTHDKSLLLPIAKIQHTTAHLRPLGTWHIEAYKTNVTITTMISKYSKCCRLTAQDTHETSNGNEESSSQNTVGTKHTTTRADDNAMPLDTDTTNMPTNSPEPAYLPPPPTWHRATQKKIPQPPDRTHTHDRRTMTERMRI